jgi:serine/threonine protein kinase
MNILLIIAAIYITLGICVGVLIGLRRHLRNRSKSGKSVKQPSAAKAAVHQVYGHYELKQPPYKQGGMATIWRAAERKTGRPCIIKTPRRGTTIDNVYLDKLMLEARYLKKLKHPCIVKYVDDFYNQGEFHLVLEYLDGDTLLASTQRSPVAEQQVVFWACQMLEVLSYIHDHSIIHRDINAKNIMVCGDGTVKLIDFGTAKNLKDAGKDKARHDPFTQITNKGFDIPELMGGESDQRCDLCGLAQTCIYLLTLKQPNEMCSELFKFSWPRSYKEARIIADYLVTAGISGRTAKLLAQGIMYSPDDRFASARAMQAALSAIDGYDIKPVEVVLQK